MAPEDRVPNRSQKNKVGKAGNRGVPQAARAKSGQSVDQPRRLLPILIVSIGFIAYLALFYATEAPSISQVTGAKFVRGAFWRYLLLPDELAQFWFGDPPEFSLADRVPVLLGAAAIVAVATCLGRLLLALVRIDRGLTTIEVFAFSAAAGLNAVSTYMLAVGLLGWLGSRWAVLAPFALIFAATAWLYWRRRQKNRKQKSEASSAQEAAQREKLWPWIVVASIFTAMILLGAMLPPVDFDVREYHLQAPKEFLGQGRVTFLPHNVYANMPLGTEMLSLVGMILAGDWWLGALIGKTVIAIFTPITALALWSAGRRWFSPTAGAIAAVVYLSVPWIVQVSTAGLVEGASACYLFLAVYALALACSSSSSAGDAQTNWAKDSLPSPLGLVALAGYLAGGAVSCKYPAVLFVVAPLTVVLFWWIARQGGHWLLVSECQTGATGPVGATGCLSASVACAPNPTEKGRPAYFLVQLSTWKPLGVFLIAAAIGCGLWFAKNWAFTGNPTYPLLYSVFGGESWTAEKDRQWNQVHRPHDFSPGTLAKDLARVALVSEWLSPAVLPLAVLAFWRRSWRKPVILLAAYFGFVIAGWWLLTHRIDRFWLPALPLVALLAGIGATWSRHPALRAVLIGFLAITTTSNFLTAGVLGGSYFVSLDRLRREPGRIDPWHRYFNEHVRDGRILLVGDAQPFDLIPPVYYSTCFDDSLFEQIAKDRSPEEIWASLAEVGVTHIYVHWSEIRRYRSTYGFTDFVQPDVFDRLVAAKILDPLPPLGDHPGRAYRVRDRHEKIK